MNRVLEVNERNAYALVEPGVSYFDLYDHITKAGLDVWIDAPDPGWGSLIGNALDGGGGWTASPFRDHFGSHCGMTTRRKLRQWTVNMLASHSDAPLVSAARNVAHRVTALLHTENHDIRTNGEARVLRCLDPGATTIVDVGANRGAWALLCHQLVPRADIYCFEIASATRQRLRENVAAVGNIYVHELVRQ